MPPPSHQHAKSATYPSQKSGNLGPPSSISASSKVGAPNYPHPPIKLRGNGLKYPSTEPSACSWAMTGNINKVLFLCRSKINIWACASFRIHDMLIHQLSILETFNGWILLMGWVAQLSLSLNVKGLEFKSR
jgi:hypothetical protein